LADDDPVVQIQTARTLAGLGKIEEAIPVLRSALHSKSEYLSLQAILAIDECDLLSINPSLRKDIKKMKKGSYSVRVIKKLLGPEARSTK
jgi:HEAT repeat protein